MIVGGRLDLTGSKFPVNPSPLPIVILTLISYGVVLGKGLKAKMAT